MALTCSTLAQLIPDTDRRTSSIDTSCAETAVLRVDCTLEMDDTDWEMIDWDDVRVSTSVFSLVMEAVFPAT